jgi:hypothetical protein
MISFKVPEDIKEKMKKYPHINWSEIARNAIIERIEFEEQITHIEIDSILLNDAIKIQDQIRAKTTIHEEWASTEEIRKWRKKRQ